MRRSRDEAGCQWIEGATHVDLYDKDEYAAIVLATGIVAFLAVGSAPGEQREPAGRPTARSRCCNLYAARPKRDAAVTAADGR